MDLPWIGELRPGPHGAAQAASSVIAREQIDFVELYRKHAAYVWKSARRLGVTPAELDDVVQETFLTVYRLLDHYEPRGSERSWLFAVLFRVVQHHRRSWKRRPDMSEEETNLDALPGDARAPDKSAEASESLRVLEEILDGLDPEKRAVLILADLEEKSVSEIAEILSIKPNTAWSRLRLAREYVDAAMARHQARDGWRYK